MTAERTDEELLAAYRAGEVAAFEELYDRYATRLTAYITGLLGDRHEAEDALQDALAGFARQALARGKVASVRAYLFAAARNSALNRARARKGAALPEEGAEILTRMRSDAQENARLLGDRRKLLNAALARLSGEEREVVLLKSQGDMTFREIGSMLGASQFTMAARYRAALKKMRSYIERVG